MKRSKRYSTIYIWAGIIASAAAVSMVIFPAVILDSAKQGIALWASSVLPALLPFFICADFMISLGIPGIVGAYYERPFQKLFGTPGASAFVFIASVTSGYPMGPKLIGQMRRRGELTDREGIRMLSFCSTSGPLFMLGTVGAGMLHSPAAGAVVAVSHYMAAIVNGLLLRLFGKKDKGQRKCIRTRYAEPTVAKKTMLEILTDSIISSLKTLGIICCYIIIFTYATDLLEMTGALSLLKNSHDSGFVKGLLEMTIGVNEIAASEEIGLRLKCTMAAFLVSFGGLSIFAQSISVLGGLKISPFVYLKLKLSHGVIAAIIAYMSAPYILNRAVQNVGLFSNPTGVFQPGFLMQLLFSVRMLIIIVILFLFTVIIELILSWRKETSD